MARDDINMAETIAHILRDWDGTLDQAIDRIKHLKCSSDVMLGALALLACQLGAVERQIDMRASVALSNIRLTLEEWERHRGDS